MRHSKEEKEIVTDKEVPIVKGSNTPKEKKKNNYMYWVIFVSILLFIALLIYGR